MVGFIDAHRDAHGVEPICSVLPIAPSTYYEHLAKRADLARLSDRARRDEALRPEILRVRRYAPRMLRVLDIEAAGMGDVCLDDPGQQAAELAQAGGRATFALQGLDGDPPLALTRALKPASWFLRFDMF